MSGTARNKSNINLTHDKFISFMNLLHHLELLEKNPRYRLRNYSLSHAGYIMSHQGVCFGIACMAMQAALIDDLQSFRKRLILIDRCTNIMEGKTLNEEILKNILSIIKKSGYNLQDLAAFFDGLLYIFNQENMKS